MRTDESTADLPEGDSESRDPTPLVGREVWRTGRRTLAATSPLLTIPQLVALLEEHGMTVSERQVYRLLQAGVIPSQRPNGQRGAYLVHKQDVLRWIEEGHGPSRSPVTDPALAVLAELIRGLLDGTLEFKVTLSRSVGRR